jgi:hypothetical protein
MLRSAEVSKEVCGVGVDCDDDSEANANVARPHSELRIESQYRWPGMKRHDIRVPCATLI